MKKINLNRLNVVLMDKKQTNKLLAEKPCRIWGLLININKITIIQNMNKLYHNSNKGIIIISIVSFT